jgi:bacterioferritin
MAKKKHGKSIELLNKAVADELLAIHQYMYFHFHCDDQGYDLLASLFKNTAIQEMGHVEVLSERILFLNGDVDMKVVGAVKKIKEPKEMVKCAAQMEDDSAKEYNEWANICSANADSASKKIFEDLVLDEEKHFDQFDTEMENMEKFGENYLALQSIERSKLISSAGTAAE